MVLTEQVTAAYMAQSMHQKHKMPIPTNQENKFIQNDFLF